MEKWPRVWIGRYNGTHFLGHGLHDVIYEQGGPVYVGLCNCLFAWLNKYGFGQAPKPKLIYVLLI